MLLVWRQHLFYLLDFLAGTWLHAHLLIHRCIHILKYFHMTYYCKRVHVNELDISVCVYLPLIGLPGHASLQSQVYTRP